VSRAGLCRRTENIDGDVSADIDDAIAKARHRATPSRFKGRAKDRSTHRYRINSGTVAAREIHVPTSLAPKVLKSL